MARTNVTVVLLLGILAVAGAVLSRAGIVSQLAAVASGLIWFAYMGYWVYEHQIAGGSEE